MLLYNIKSKSKLQNLPELLKHISGNVKHKSKNLNYINQTPDFSVKLKILSQNQLSCVQNQILYHYKKIN